MKLFSHETREKIIVTTILILGTLFMEYIGLLTPLEGRFLDAFVRAGNKELAPHISIVKIDNADYDHLFEGKSPLPIKPFQSLLDKICAAKPELIVVDIDTASKDFQSLKTECGVEIIWGVAAAVVEHETSWGNAIVNFFRWAFLPGHEEHEIKVSGVLGNHDTHSRKDVGVPLFPIDEDGVVRKFFPEMKPKGGEPIPSLALAARESYCHKHPCGKAPQHEVILPFKSRYAFPVNNAATIMNTDPKGLSEVLKDKVVFLGGTYSGARDDYQTPLGIMPGLELNAHTFAAAVDGGIEEVNRWFAIALDVIAAILIMQFFTHKNRLDALYTKLHPWPYRGGNPVRTAMLISIIFCPIFAFTCSLIVFRNFHFWITFIPVIIGTLLHCLWEESEMHGHSH